MKKFIVALSLALISTVTYAETYECTAYVNGSAIRPPIKVEATKVAIAETKALSRMKKNAKKVDYVKCK